MDFTTIENIIKQLEADVQAKVDELKGRIPAGAVVPVAAVETLILDAITTALPGIQDVLIQQIKDTLMAGHGPVAKSGVDLA